MRGLLRTIAIIAIGLASSLFSEGSRAQAGPDAERLLKASWEDIVKEARGKTVRWWMWAGDAGVNQYVDEWVIPRVKDLYGITLQRVAVKDTAEGVRQVIGEKEAGKLAGGTVDLNWISGDNLFTMKQAGLLFQGYRDKLPNAKLVNWEDPVIKFDRAEPVDGAAIAWGRYQQVLTYDSSKVPKPPATIKDLGDWIKANPGRFTYPAPPDFTGTNFVLLVLYEISGGADQWAKPFDQALWDKHAPKVWELINSWKPQLWRKGETYPENISALDQLYGSGEVWWSSSMYNAVPGRNVVKGLFPKATRTLLIKPGTISASHTIGIPFNAAQKAAAMVVIDFLIGPEPQLQKALPEVWGIGTILDLARLAPQWKQRFDNLPRVDASLALAELDAHKVPAPHAKYIIQLNAGWKEHVLQKR